MPLPAPTAARQILHHRDITVRGYKREDGMFDIEGHLHDTKEVDFKVASGKRNAGESLHSMWLRITIDRTFTIIEAEASTDAMPYVGYCDQIAPEYKRLIGLAIVPGFTNRVRELLGGTSGCTHLTDLIGVVATTAFQTVAGQGLQSLGDKPFQLGRCHALALTSPAVARYYPQWYKGDQPATAPAPEPENH